MVDGSSHSAYASDAALVSGFSLYARPIRILKTEYEMMHRCARERRQKSSSRTPYVFVRRLSDLVIRDARGLRAIVGSVDLEIGEERARFFLQQPQYSDRHAPDFKLGPFAAAQLEHRAPRARVPRDDDLHLGRVRQHTARRFAGHFPPVHLVGEDRKSTRLNSSHMSLSYAVFCLKKKKKKNIFFFFNKKKKKNKH